MDTPCFFSRPADRREAGANFRIQVSGDVCLFEDFLLNFGLPDLIVRKSARTFATRSSGAGGRRHLFVRTKRCAKKSQGGFAPLTPILTPQGSA